jgi:hypothetical protein
MEVAAPAGESGCEAGWQERPAEATCQPLRNTAFGYGAKTDSPFSRPNYHLSKLVLKRLKSGKKHIFAF